jgi:hypothetical protein
LMIMILFRVETNPSKHSLGPPSRPDVLFASETKRSCNYLSITRCNALSSSNWAF